MRFSFGSMPEAQLSLNEMHGSARSCTDSSTLCRMTGLNTLS